ncbi:DUF3703 domain-containing protein [Streptomyces sp. NPDC088935]|uniref:DUF3703 domain-containing protein n=1 Tax=Streptomyces sp. NPDC088935 TaxID=3365916 RepID=UPI00382F583B
MRQRIGSASARPNRVSASRSVARLSMDATIHAYLNPGNPGSSDGSCRAWPQVLRQLVRLVVTAPGSAAGNHPDGNTGRTRACLTA